MTDTANDKGGSAGERCVYEGCNKTGDRLSNANNIWSFHVDCLIAWKKDVAAESTRRELQLMQQIDFEPDDENSMTLDEYLDKRLSELEGGQL